MVCVHTHMCVYVLGVCVCFWAEFLCDNLESIWKRQSFRETKMPFHLPPPEDVSPHKNPAQLGCPSPSGSRPGHILHIRLRSPESQGKQCWGPRQVPCAMASVGCRRQRLAQEHHLSLIHASHKYSACCVPGAINRDTSRASAFTGYS